MQARPANSLNPQHADKRGVLVVDDNHLVNAMLQLGLERNGFDVWCAESGRDAIALYRKEKDHIAVALIDVQMPGLDGPATLDGLRALNSEIVACFMSGDTGVYDVEDLLRRGASVVIPKPFLLKDLADTLHQLTNGAMAT
jgi:CheY-like chemotaxis protein